LQAKATRVESRAEHHVGVVAVTIRKAYVAVIAAEQGNGISGVVVFGVAGELGTELVVTETERVDIATGTKW